MKQKQLKFKDLVKIDENERSLKKYKLLPKSPKLPKYLRRINRPGFVEFDALVAMYRKDVRRIKRSSYNEYMLNYNTFWDCCYGHPSYRTDVTVGLDYLYLKMDKIKQDEEDSFEILNETYRKLLYKRLRKYGKKLNLYPDEELLCVSVLLNELMNIGFGYK